MSQSSGRFHSFDDMLTATAVVACALNLLGRSMPTPVPIQFMEHPPAGVSQNAEAFLERNPDTIYLITSTEAFRSARRDYDEPGQRAGCQKLASIIVHEEWHARHGSDEDGAYAAQITALMSLGAEPAMVTQVRRSMRAVLKAQRQLAKAAPPALNCRPTTGCRVPPEAAVRTPDVVLLDRVSLGPAAMASPATTAPQSTQD